MNIKHIINFVNTLGAGSCASVLETESELETFSTKNFYNSLYLCESCALSKLNCKQRKSIGTQNSLDFFVYKSLSVVAIDFTQSTWFTKVKWIVKSFFRKYFQFTFSFQNTCTWSGPGPR